MNIPFCIFLFTYYVLQFFPCQYIQSCLAPPAPPFFLIFWLHRAACWILVPGPGIEPAPRALEARSLNRWTARGVPSPF